MEQQEINLLNKKGFYIETEKRSLLKFFGRKTRKWNVSFVSLGMMDMLSEYFYKMSINESKLSSEDYNEVFSEQKRLTRENAKACATVMAISVACSLPCIHWGFRRVNIWILKKFLTNYFLWRVDSQMLFKYASAINEQYDFRNFMTSIALLHEHRTTKATTIEESKVPTE